MRSKLIPAVVAASLAFGGVVFAAAPAYVTGTIKAIDAKAMTITMDDGTVYDFAATMKLAGFKVGEKVTIGWEMMGGKHMASAIKAD